MDKPNEDLKFRLNKALSLRDMKPIELSKLTGIPKSAISQYMSGYTKPKNDRIYLICKALNINEAWLMGYDVEMDKKEYTKKSADQDFDLLDKFELLKPEDKQLILDMIDSLLKRSGV